MPTDIQIIIAFTTLLTAGLFGHEEAAYHSTDEIISKKNKWLFRFLAVILVFLVYLLVIECSSWTIVIASILAFLARVISTRETWRYMLRSQKQYKKTREHDIQQEVKEILGEFFDEGFEIKKISLLELLMQFKDLQEDVQKIFDQAMKDKIPERRGMKTQELREIFRSIIKQRKVFEEELLETIKVSMKRIRTLPKFVDQHIEKLETLIQETQKTLEEKKQEVRSFQKKFRKK